MEGIAGGKGRRGACAKAQRQRGWLVLGTLKSSTWLEIRVGGWVSVQREEVRERVANF